VFLHLKLRDLVKKAEKKLLSSHLQTKLQMDKKNISWFLKLKSIWMYLRRYSCMYGCFSEVPWHLTVTDFNGDKAAGLLQYF